MNTGYLDPSKSHASRMICAALDRNLPMADDIAHPLFTRFRLS